MTTDNVLEVRDLTKVYGRGDAAVRAIDNISFNVLAREFVSIVGPSGAGKSTLLKCLSGLMAPTSGEALLNGDRIVSPPPGMALVFQDYNRSLLPWLSVRKNVEMPLKHIQPQGPTRSERAERVDRALEAVNLTRFRDHHPWQLSGGMQQRVAIARALAYQPQLLLMDEPFASVDAQTRTDLEDLVLNLKALYEMTVLFVTHDIDESVYLSDRVIVLSSSPARVRESITVGLPIPRDQIATREHPDFARMRSRVYELVKRPSTAVPLETDVPR